MSATQPAQPLFALGQRVRVISNHGGLYSAQIGVVGVIAKQRQKRRYGYRSYDVAYMKPFSLPNEKGREKIVIVREDDLEAVEAASVEESPKPSTTPPVAPFRIGQRVTVHPPADGAEDEYPSFTHYPIVGEIASACQVTAAGVHCYDVRFPRIERGVASDFWPPVSIREAHLAPEPSQVGWMAHAAAMARTKAPQNRQPQSQPKFAVGEHVTVDTHSAMCYETFTRKGAVGKIIEVGKPVRGIRRYTVRFEVARLGGARESRIREEHLVKAEAPAPRQYAQARHAYEYHNEHPRDPHLWCDAGGCFIKACPVCQQHPAPTLFTTPSSVPSSVAPATAEPPPALPSALPYSTATLAALAAGDAYEFAVTLVRDKLERGVWRDAILTWQATPQWIHSVDGGTCYDVTRGGVYLTMLNGQKCSIRYALKVLMADAERRIAGVPQQVSLWGSEVSV